MHLLPKKSPILTYYLLILHNNNNNPSLLPCQIDIYGSARTLVSF